MHSSRELRSSSFEVSVGGRPARLEELFEGFGQQDRLGVVMRRPCGAVGAVPVETYRRIGLEEALRLLGSPAAAPAG